MKMAENMIYAHAETQHAITSIDLDTALFYPFILTIRFPPSSPSLTPSSPSYLPLPCLPLPLSLSSLPTSFPLLSLHSSLTHPLSPFCTFSISLTHNSIIDVPGVITHCTPHSIVLHFHTTTAGGGASHQT